MVGDMIFEVGDYISFERIVHPKVGVKFRTNYETGGPICLPEIPEQILPQRGAGQILKIATKPRRVGGEKLATARVAAGSGLGTVTAILDDATLTAKPLTMFDLEPEAGSQTMYGTDGSHS
jgi:hypothetical protein